MKKESIVDLHQAFDYVNQEFVIDITSLTETQINTYNLTN